MSKKFWKIYKIYIIVFSVIIISLFVTLWLFLSSFEKSEPTNLVMDVIDNFENKKINKIKKYIEIKNEDINKKEIIDELILEKINKNDFSYEKINSSEQVLKYSINGDNYKIATIVLKLNDKKGMFNLKRWDVLRIDDLLPEARTINIISPKGYEIYLYDELLKDDYLTEDNYLTKELTNIKKYTEVDSLNKYTVEGIYKEPNIKSIFNNKEVEIIKKEDNYFVKFASNENILNEQSNYIKNFCTNYTRYVINEQGFNSISSYVISSSNAYKFLRSIANSNQWMGNHTKAVFSDINLTNMQMYNENAFSVEANYNYSYKVLNKEQKYETNLTIYMVKQNNEWKIADLII